MSIAREKNDRERKSLALLTDRKTSRNIKLVAEGDSWFDYKIQRDIIDYLQIKGYAVGRRLNQAKAGDTLENMVYGEEFRINRLLQRVYNPGPVSMKATLKAVKKYKPRFVLFSAGGNDIVGEEIITYLNHKQSNARSSYRKAVFENHVKNVMKPAIQSFIDQVLATDPTVDILMDGYDYAIPNGTRINLGVAKFGPWILPSMGKKGITDPKEQKRIIKALVDTYNKMLKELDSKNRKFHYINLRGMFPDPREWDNEIHLKRRGFRTVANVYHNKIVEILGKNPLR